MSQDIARGPLAGHGVKDLSRYEREMEETLKIL